MPQYHSRPWCHTRRPRLMRVVHPRVQHCNVGIAAHSHPALKAEGTAGAASARGLKEEGGEGLKRGIIRDLRLKVCAAAVLVMRTKSEGVERPGGEAGEERGRV
ncbi:hypothetical protein TSOC_009297 [Tetrabaena socialis]|uniref:Uncharacterized protein n=1 Tax=Tetrabaena socialis TaxID=47790 RepID=A0A2J7ZW77_9CHLO|nr:hypothetical protein TSOC_009297 [Tetrabaena socialis]|eukprot:PNH04523.1 hypothetical protein TSOC_009297 [Tetrabaena socialis]